MRAKPTMAVSGGELPLAGGARRGPGTSLRRARSPEPPKMTMVAAGAGAELMPPPYYWGRIRTVRADSRSAARRRSSTTPRSSSYDFSKETTPSPWSFSPRASTSMPSSLQVVERPARLVDPFEDGVAQVTAVVEEGLEGLLRKGVHGVGADEVLDVEEVGVGGVLRPGGRPERALHAGPLGRERLPRARSEGGEVVLVDDLRVREGGLSAEGLEPLACSGAGAAPRLLGRGACRRACRRARRRRRRRRRPSTGRPPPATKAATPSW